MEPQAGSEVIIIKMQLYSIHKLNGSGMHKQTQTKLECDALHKQTK